MCLCKYTFLFILKAASKDKKKAEQDKKRYPSLKEILESRQRQKKEATIQNIKQSVAEEVNNFSQLD